MNFLEIENAYEAYIAQDGVNYSMKHAFVAGADFVLANTRHANNAPRTWQGCRACYGSGGKRIDPCKVCQGTGKVPKVSS